MVRGVLDTFLEPVACQSCIYPNGQPRSRPIQNPIFESSSYTNSSVEGIKGCQMAGHSFWENMATRERESLETHCVESLLVVYLLYVSLLSLIDAKRHFFCP